MIRREKRTPKKETSSKGTQSGSNGAHTSLKDGQCVEIWDVYYNLYTGEVVDEVYIGTDCGGSPGSPGGGGGGGGGDGTSGTGPDGNPYADDGPLTLGDHAKMMVKHYNATTDLYVLLEYTESTHQIDKVSITAQGLTLGTTFAQIGNGVASYLSGHDAYNFTVSGQFTTTSPWTGNVQTLAPVTISGTYYPATNTYKFRP